jgi:dolichol-phosphate mannosyltransferase
MTARSIVIIPTYNECENVEAIIRAVFGQPEHFHVLIVDDGSPDGTALIVRKLMADEFKEKLHLLERAGKLGLGTAYIAGFRWGLVNGYDYFFEMDADFSHNPDDLVRLLAKCRDEGAGVSVGSRYCAGGDVKNWPFDRIFLSRGASLYVRFVLWMPVSDPTAGFICYQRKVLETIDLDKIHFIGYAFQIEMKFAAYTLGFKVKEVPIIFKDREKGKSKMSLKIIREAILGVLQMRVFAWGKGYGHRA